MKRSFFLVLSMASLLLLLSHSAGLRAQTTPRLVVFESFMRPI